MTPKLPHSADAPSIRAVIFALAVFAPLCLRADQPPAWTLRDSGTKQALNGLAGNGALFVVVGSAGTILTSPDAVTWSPQASPSKLDLNGVAWYHGKFVAVGNNGLVLTSPNGISWTAQDSHTKANLRSVTADEYTLVAVGDQGAIFVSANGEKWGAPSTPRFSANGANRSASAPPRTLSARGGRAMFTTPPLPDLSHVVSTPQGFMFVTNHVILTSGVSGLVWTTVDVAPPKNTSTPAPATRGDTRPSAPENSGAYVIPVPTPADRYSGPPPTPVRPNGSGSARGVGGRLGVGSRGAAPPPPNALYSVAQNNDLTIAVGDSAQIWTLPKGGDWSRLKNPLPGELTERLDDIYWSGRHFITVGANGSIFISSDGLHWRQPFSPVREGLAAVSGRPGLVVAVGADGAIVTNEDLPVIAPPVISPAGGLFKARPLVTLSCPTPGVTLHYTMDGTEPANTSIAYDQPFLISKPGTLRVRAFKDGMDASLETSADFRLPVVATITESSGQVRAPYPQSTIDPLAHFFVKTTGATPAATFHWQFKPVGKDVWVDYTNGSTNSVSADTSAPGGDLKPKKSNNDLSKSVIENSQRSDLEIRFDPSMSGGSFRCLVSNEAGTVVSDEMKLVTFTPIGAAIVEQPVDDDVIVGNTAAFTVKAIGDPAPSYQWLMHVNDPPPFLLQQYAVNGAVLDMVMVVDGANYSGAHTPTLTVHSPTLKMNGDEFICIVDNGYQPDGTPNPKNSLSALWTSRATLQVWKPKPLVLTQPSSVVATPGSIVAFRAGISQDIVPNIQWQYRPPGGKDWLPLKDSLLYTGAHDPTLTINLTSLDLSGSQYRCEVDDGLGGLPQYSAIVTLTVKK